jgi:hypothetical protein
MNAPRPRYWKGFDFEQDSDIAMELFYGKVALDRYQVPITEFSIPDSAQERQARQALCRLLSWTLFNHSTVRGGLVPGPDLFDMDNFPRRLPIELIVGLTTALDPDGGSERYLLFQARQKKQGPRPNVGKDWLIANHIDFLVTKAKWKKEAAVQEAMATYHLSRKAVYEILKRSKKREATT